MLQWSLSQRWIFHVCTEILRWQDLSLLVLSDVHRLWGRGPQSLSQRGEVNTGAPVVPPATLIVFFALRYLIYPLVIQGFANWNITISNLEQMLNLEHQHFKHFHRHFIDEK